MLAPSARFGIRYFSTDLTRLMVRPPSGYMLFIKDANVAAMMKQKNIKASEALKINSASWNGLSAMEKKSYGDKAQVAKQNKDKQIAALPQEQKKVLDAMRRLNLLKRKDKKGYLAIRKKVVRETKYPTHTSAIGLYISENIKSGGGSLKAVQANKPYAALTPEAKNALSERAAEMNVKAKSAGLENWKKQTKNNSLLEAMAKEYLVKQNVIRERKAAAALKVKAQKMKVAARLAEKKKLAADRLRQQRLRAKQRQMAAKARAAAAKKKPVKRTAAKKVVKAKGKKVAASKVKTSKAKLAAKKKPAAKKKVVKGRR